MKTDVFSKTLFGLVIWIISTTFAFSQSDFDRNTTPQIELPGLTDFTPQTNTQTGDSPQSARTVRLEAVLLDDGEPIENGLIWRVFDPVPGEDGKLTLIASAQGGSHDMELGEGEYFIHVAFGRAGVTKRVSVPNSGEILPQKFVLDAGGIVLKAVSGDNQRIPSHLLNFEIYSGLDGNAQDSERQLVLESVKPNLIVRLNEGIYHVVSRYGDINAVTRADIRVIKGKLTEIQMQHRAAEATFKLVSKSGGEGIADTAWSVYSSSGDIIGEMVGAFPQLVLSEGDYTAIALHQSKEYPLDFHIAPGKNVDVEILLTR